MCQQVCLVRRQNRAEESQALKLAELPQGRLAVRIDCDGERRMVTENSEKDKFAVVDEFLDVLMLEQYRMLCVGIDEALISPDGHEATVFIRYRVRQPVEILTSFATSVDEGAAKYVLVIHLPVRVQALA